jgi:hypothetical protein
VAHCGTQANPRDHLLEMGRLVGANHPQSPTSTEGKTAASTLVVDTILAFC